MIASPRKKLGPFLATMLVAGNMIGSGLFLLPATLGRIGGLSVVAWGLGTAGALIIAAVFARLGVLAPWAGGPYAYARAMLGRYFGFQTNYIYWICVWVGNVGIALAATGYLSEFVPAIKLPFWSALTTSTVIWLMVGANIVGPRFVAKLESLTLLMGLAPIAVLATVGWAWFDPGLFMASWNVSGRPAWDVLPESMILVFWAFTGLESAAVAEEVIDNPRRNLPIAALCGVALAAVVYTASCTVVMGIVPAEALAGSAAPFALVTGHLFGPLAATLLTVTTILKATGTHAGWTLLSAATAKAAADGGSFPAVFGQVDARGVPVRGFLIVGALMTAAAFATMSPSLGEQFDKLIDISTVFCVLTYLYSALAFALLPGRSPRTLIADRLLAGAAILFSAWVILASDQGLLLASIAIGATSFLVYPFYRGEGRPSLVGSAAAPISE